MLMLKTKDLSQLLMMILEKLQRPQSLESISVAHSRDLSRCSLTSRSPLL